MGPEPPMTSTLSPRLFVVVLLPLTSMSWKPPTVFIWTLAPLLVPVPPRTMRMPVVSPAPIQRSWLLVEITAAPKPDWVSGPVKPPELP